MTAGPESEYVQTMRRVVAERPTFAAAALLRIHDLHRENLQLKLWLKIFHSYGRMPAPRPALTADQIDQITADVIAELKQQERD